MFIHSSSKKTWSVADRPELLNTAKRLSDGMSLSLAAARLLTVRGYGTKESASDFIGKKTELLHDPFLMRDMDKAVSRISSAITAGEKTVIYGDYDVDGVTSVTVLYKYLKSLGADVSYYIPNRIGEGYGINAEAIRNFAADGVRLMVTVDTGITAVDEIAEARSLGIDTVVTDHHECRPELPEAVAVVNPCRPDCDYPFTELAGVGVAYKLACAIEMRHCGKSFSDAVRSISDRYCDLVAIGTVADVMPLIGENRIIVSRGLQMMESTENVGLRALMRASGLTGEDEAGRPIKKKLTSAAVGFTIAPRINAAGRISSAEFAVELFITEDDDRAKYIAEGLCETNRRRQAEENSIIESAEAKIAEQCSPDDYVIVLDDDHWHHGVIGIVCSRLTEKYNLPSILISFEHNMGETPSDADMGKGSGRSVSGFNLFDALADSSGLLTKFGGHELAAGLSIERGKLSDFRRRINDFARGIFGDSEPERTVNIDIKITPEEITEELASELYLLEPFGVANAQPVFETDRLIITDVTSLAGGKHTKLTLRAAGIPTLYTALCFGTPTEELPFSAGDAVDAVYNLDINEYRGKRTVQMLIRDIRKTVSAEVPDRDGFASLYRYLKQLGSGHVFVDLKSASAELSVSEDTLLLMLDVFAELNMIFIFRGEAITVKLLPVTGKTPLEASRILASLTAE